MGTASLADLIGEVRAASERISATDGNMKSRIDQIETSVNDLFKTVNRPGRGGAANDNDDLERKDAIAHCIVKHNITVPRDEGTAAVYVPSSSEIDDALLARKALRNYFRHGDVNKLDALERKSLSSFSFGNSGWIVPPQVSSQVLSCLADQTDLTGQVNHVLISGQSIVFPIDNVRLDAAAWACESSCFANNPFPDLQAGMGRLEIKAESLRYVLCANTDLLADSSFNIEAWLMEKVSRGFRVAINAALLLGDGIGRPLGILHPNAGVPICETAVSTPPGVFSWQDLVQLAYQIPLQWHSGAAYYMNQQTFALLATMSDGTGRPLFGQLPTGAVGPQFAGFPIRIATQLPNVEPGSTPILFGNLRAGYTLVDRQATTLIVDPYSAGYCHLFKWEARIGGAPTCPNSLRLLRIR